MIGRLNPFAWDRQDEFPIIWLYISAVFLHGVCANWHPPILEVVWDMVFYKNLAYGLHHISSFELQRHFPVPPLYPLLISPVFFASDYLMAEWLLSWINPAMYFLGLYPAYWYARSILNPRQSAWVCLLYALYPSAIYTQWTMSENLAAPLVMWAMALSVRLITDERPRMRDGTWLGIVLAAVALTRVLLIVTCAALILWIAYRTFRRNRYPAPILMAFGLSVAIPVTVWWQLGYFTNKGPSLVYATFTSQPFHTLLNMFLTILAAQGTGLWLEGGLIVTVLIGLKWLTTLRDSGDVASREREVAQLVFFLLATLWIAVSAYYVKRTEIEPWSVSLRYIFYGNLIGLPLVVAMQGVLREAGVGKRISYSILLLVFIALFGVSLSIPESWQKIRESHEYFTNAPSLDFLYQIRNGGSGFALGFLASVSFLLGIIFLGTRRAGAVLLCLALAYLQFSALDYTQYIRQRAWVNQDVSGIHDFCHEIQAGKWKDLTIYCEESDQAPFLMPNLLYWVQRASGYLPPETPRPNPPYLLLTTKKHGDGELAFQSGNVRAYLHRKP